jgi:hypothetical protein
LERKVEELVAKQKANTYESPSHAKDLDAKEISPVTIAGQWVSHARVPIPSEVSGPTTSRTTSTADGSVERNTADIIERGILTEEHAQTLLDRFRTRGTQYFPFVVIPADVSLYTVRKNSPFLFLAVTAVMIFEDQVLQHQLGEEIRQQVFERVFADCEKCLDLLQGLLIYTAWYCHFYRGGKREELLLSQLCVTLAHELDIDGPQKRAERLGQFNEMTRKESTSPPSAEQMRAYLGSYCISSLYVN